MREIRRNGQAGLIAKTVRSSGPGELRNCISDPRVLPHERIVERTACVAIPKNGGFALVRDADGGQIAGAQITLRQGLRDHLPRPGPDLIGIVLNPSRLGIDLLMFLLGSRDHLGCTVQNKEPRASGALVNRSNVFGHRQKGNAGLR